MAEKPKHRGTQGNKQKDSRGDRSIKSFLDTLILYRKALVLVLKKYFGPRFFESFLDHLISGFKSFLGFFLEHLPFVLSLLYLYVTALGMLNSWVLFSEFRVNIFDYSEIGDFLLAGLSRSAIVLAVPDVIFYLIVLLLLVAMHDTVMDQVRLGQDQGSRVVLWLLAIMLTLGVVTSSVFRSYTGANIHASSIKDGETPTVDVRYRSFSSSAGQVTEPELQIIGATQKTIFFYDVNAKRTIVIPQAQIVSIEVPQ